MIVIMIMSLAGDTTEITMLGKWKSKRKTQQPCACAFQHSTDWREIKDYELRNEEQVIKFRETRIGNEYIIYNHKKLTKKKEKNNF